MIPAEDKNKKLKILLDFNKPNNSNIKNLINLHLYGQLRKINIANIRYIKTMEYIREEQ